MTPTAHTHASRAHAVSAGCLASERSREARAAHRATIHSFVAAGAAHLLRGPPWRKGGIRRAFIAVTDTSNVDAWDTVDTRADSFLKFVQRNRFWVAAVLDGTAA